MNGKLVASLLREKKAFLGRVNCEFPSNSSYKSNEFMILFDGAVYIFSILRMFESVYEKMYDRKIDFAVFKSISYESLLNIIKWIFVSNGNDAYSNPEFENEQLSNDALSFLSWISVHHLQLPVSTLQLLTIISSFSSKEISLFQNMVQCVIQTIEKAETRLEDSDSSEKFPQFVLSPAFLEEYFESSLDFSSKKRSGTVYTPKIIANYIVKRLVEEKLQSLDNNNQEGVCNSLINFKVMDPCCGCGSFVIAYLETIETYLARLPDPNERKCDLVDLIDHIIKNSIYTFDLNMDALSVLKIRLTLFYYKVLLKFALKRKNKTLSSYNLESHILKRNPLIFYGRNMLQIAMLLQNQPYSLRITKNLAYDPEFISRFKNLSISFDEIIEMTEITNDSERSLTIDKMSWPSFDPIDYVQTQSINSLLLTFKLSLSNLNILYPVSSSEVPYPFDIIFGNPPYIRADNQDPEYKSQRNLIKLLFTIDLLLKSSVKMKWDFYIAFLSMCSIRFLKEDGCLGFIISESFGYSEFSEPIRKSLLSDFRLIELVHFEKNKVFNAAAVRPMILLFQKSISDQNTEIIMKWLKDTSFSQSIIRRISQLKADYRYIFRGIESTDTIEFDSAYEFETLDNICYLSVGIVANAHELIEKSAFKKSDIIFEEPLPQSKKYLEGKDLEPYRIKKYRYIEWGTERSPKKLRRPTFPELYIGKKILIGTMVAGTIEEDAIVNHSIVVMRLWKDLKGINNQSIKIKERTELEDISEHYSYEYLLALFNSALIRNYLNSIRVSNINKHIQPNDFRKVPIPKLQNQHAYIQLVKLLIRLKANQDQKDTNYTKKIEQIIDTAVFELYYSKQWGTNFNDALIAHLKEIDIKETQIDCKDSIDHLISIVERINVPVFK